MILCEFQPASIGVKILSINCLCFFLALEDGTFCDTTLVSVVDNFLLLSMHQGSFSVHNRAALYSIF